MIEQKILQLIELGEGYHLELKEKADKSLIEEVCAFANSSGGKILLGVTDKGEIKGINTDNAFRSRVQDTVTKLEPALNIDISIEDNIIIINVPSGSDKPYGCSRGFFVRIGPNTQKLSRNEIVSFFQKEGKIRFDELENPKADFDHDFDYKIFERFKTIAKISSGLGDKQLLKNLDCLTSETQFTNAGTLFFTKSIDFLLNNATVVCVLYRGNIKLDILDKKDYNDNIIDNIENAILFVKRHTNVEYKIETLRREEIPDVPDVALREAIINAVCHRDYFNKSGTVLVEVYDNRVEISNPGGLPGDLDPADFGTKSVIRNPIIASLLMRIDYIEKVGTGIKRIQEAVAEQDTGTVEFSFDTFFTTTFSRHSAIENSLTQGGKKETTRKKWGEKSDSLLIGRVADDQKKTIQKTTRKTTRKTTQKTTQKIINLIRKKPSISMRELAETIGNITTDGIKYHLNNLKRQGIIKRIGPDKGGQWEVIE